MSSLRKTFVKWCCGCVVIILLLLVNLVIYININDGISDIVLSNEDDTIDGIVIIATDKIAKTNIADRLISSLRNHSQLSISIPIYLFTNKLSCFPSSMDNVNIINLTLENLHTKNLEISHIRPKMSKLFKMKIFDYIPIGIDTILYLDSDIIASKFFNEYYIPTFTHSLYKNKLCSILMAKESSSIIFNGGTFVVNRNISKQCLSEWYHIYVNHKTMRYDQTAMTRTNCSICYLPDNIVRFASDWNNYVRWRSINEFPLIHYNGVHHGTIKDINEECHRKGEPFQCRFRNMYPNLFHIVKEKGYC